MTLCRILWRQPCAALLHAGAVPPFHPAPFHLTTHLVSRCSIQVIVVAFAAITHPRFVLHVAPCSRVAACQPHCLNRACRVDGYLTSADLTRRARNATACRGCMLRIPQVHHVRDTVSKAASVEGVGEWTGAAPGRVGQRKMRLWAAFHHRLPLQPASTCPLAAAVGAQALPYPGGTLVATPAVIPFPPQLLTQTFSGGAKGSACSPSAVVHTSDSLSLVVHSRWRRQVVDYDAAITVENVLFHLTIPVTVVDVTSL